MPLQPTAIDHVGVRVRDAQRSEAFYRKLGFEPVWAGGPEPVVIVRSASGVEINLIVNAATDGANVLMDVPEKRAGWTHIALRTALDIDALVAQLAADGLTLSGGPTRLGPAWAVFVRDPDGNVVELRAT